MSKNISYRSLFKEIASSKGYKIIAPSSGDRKNNIDILLEGHVNGNPSVFSLDIKKRNNKNPNNWIYIEYQNSKGHKGWLYGKALFVAFETKDSFILVPRKALLDWLSSSDLVRWDLPYVDKAWNSKYRLFRRKGTLETITQIKVSDLFSIKGTQEWKKS